MGNILSQNVPLLAKNVKPGTSMPTPAKRETNPQNDPPAGTFPTDESSKEHGEQKAKKPHEIRCFDCKTSFMRGNGDFTRHLKASSCKPYQCKCGKLFRRKTYMTKHIAVRKPSPKPSETVDEHSKSKGNYDAL